MVKFKIQVLPKVSTARANTVGLSSVQSVLNKAQVNNVSQVAKASPTSNINSDIFGWYKISLDPNRLVTAIEEDGITKYAEVELLIEELKKNPAVEDAQKDYIVTEHLVPDDPYYSSSGTWGQGFDDLWGLKRIGLETAWDTTTGSSSVIVAIVDSGVDVTHTDISGNLWTNPGETPSNGTDDDGNGYIDDYYGWDWVENDNSPDDQRGHGTHVAGTVAASSNNATGVNGVSWSTKLMSLRFLNSSGNGFMSDGVLALQYAADMGADISNNSWGCSCYDSIVDDAIAYEIANDTIPIVSSGNNYNDALNNTPASSDGAITIGAIDSADVKAGFSNDGNRVDVMALGVDILSLKGVGSSVCSARVTINTNYCHISGTSMAAPHVSGLVALMKAVNSSLDTEQTRQILRTTAEDLGDAGHDTTFAYVLIDADAAVAASATPTVLTPEITTPDSRETISGTTYDIIGSADGASFVSCDLEIGSSREPSSWTNITTSGAPVSNGVLANIDTTDYPDGDYIIRLTVSDGGQDYVAAVYDIVINNFTIEITSPFNVTTLTNSISIDGSVFSGGGLPFDYYLIDYGVGASPGSYASTRITLAGGGTSIVIDGNLGTWDTSGLIDGQLYTLRVTAVATNGSLSAVTVPIGMDSTLVEGWPKLLSGDNCSSSFCHGTGSLFADLDGDGNDEIITVGVGILATATMGSHKFKQNQLMKIYQTKIRPKTTITELEKKYARTKKK